MFQIAFRKLVNYLESTGISLKDMYLGHTRRQVTGVFSYVWHIAMGMHENTRRIHFKVLIFVFFFFWRGDMVFILWNNFNMINNRVSLRVLRYLTMLKCRVCISYHDWFPVKQDSCWKGSYQINSSKCQNRNHSFNTSDDRTDNTCNFKHVDRILLPKTDSFFLF